MNSAGTRIDVTAPDAGLLPNELWLLYPLAPVVATLLLVDSLLVMPWLDIAQQLAGMLVPFVGMAAVMYPTYRWVMPRLVARRAPLVRALLHVAVVTALALLVGVAVYRPHLAMCGHHQPLWQFELSMVLISWLMTFPSLAIQAQRNRAERVERFAQAERQAALRAQLEALQARTNPHFFFNSINTVASLIGDDPALAERTLERLADIFRYALDSAKTKTVPLSREFEMVRDYLAIQQARFGSRLSSSVTLDPLVATFEVPPLLLQPLVENAILHGLAQRQGGHVEVSARREGERVIIEVRDDGPGPGASTHRGSQTSTNELRERLALVFGSLASFVLEPAPGGGCLARVALPVQVG